MRSLFNNSMSVVLKIENFWKDYRLGVFGQGMLFRDVQSWVARIRGREDPNMPVGKAPGNQREERPDLGLRDVLVEGARRGGPGHYRTQWCREVHPSQTCDQSYRAPTRGTIKIRGRVASLLEVGTGFHPELTGRENVFLNGAILGMTVNEIKRKFDEIVDFSGVEQYIDTPVKRYSSGMYVRLAFAVAAHLESEILLVDEVLAVGDAEFQKRCLGKMEGFAGSGRAVLFVSHNLASVERLCRRAILLDKGSLAADGPASHLIRDYSVSEKLVQSHRDWGDPDSAPGNHIVRLRGARIRTRDGETVFAVDIREEIGIEMVYDVLESGHLLVPNYHLFNGLGTCIFVAGDQDPLWRHRQRPAGRYVSTAWIPPNFLLEGIVFVGTALSTYNPTHVHFFEQNALSFRAIDPMDGTTARGDYLGPMPGVIMPLLKWENSYTPAEEMSAVGSAI